VPRLKRKKKNRIKEVLYRFCNAISCTYDVAFSRLCVHDAEYHSQTTTPWVCLDYSIINNLSSLTDTT